MKLKPPEFNSTDDIYELNKGSWLKSIKTIIFYIRKQCLKLKCRVAMTTLSIFNFTHRRFVHLLYNGHNIMQKKIVASAFIVTRNISSLEISKNLELITTEKLNTKVINYKLNQKEEKPLIVCLTWLLAKRTHVLKYANIYLEQGFDVLNVSVSPWQVLWPTKGIQLVAIDLLQFLKANQSYSPLVIHGFSVGAYLWGEVLVRVSQEKEKYGEVINRICGQIWDSSVDVTEIQLGVPPAVFPKNTIMQKALQQYIMYHLKTFHKVATTHYIRASQMFHTDTPKIPALFFLSKTDTIGAVTANIRVREYWESMGIPVYWKCFEKSPHVGHFRYHPQEYKAELYAFIDKLSIVAQPKKIQVIAKS